MSGEDAAPRERRGAAHVGRPAKVRRRAGTAEIEAEVGDAGARCQRSFGMTRPEPLVQSLQVGELKCYAIQAGGQRLDGGAMFGVVPKPLWEKRIPADERNRIQLGMRCLLVEHPDGLLLIDTGAGNKETPKFLDIYGIENAGDDSRTALEDGIRA